MYRGPLTKKAMMRKGMFSRKIKVPIETGSTEDKTIAMPDILDTGIQFLPGVGPRRAALLGKELGIETYRDMLYTFPFRYVDRSNVMNIADLEPTMAYVQIWFTY